MFGSTGLARLFRHVLTLVAVASCGALPRVKSWTDTLAARTAAYSSAASIHFHECLAAFIWCCDQRELLIKIGAVTGFADGRFRRSALRSEIVCHTHGSDRQRLA
jgi:hypothetical protein